MRWWGWIGIGIIVNIFGVLTYISWQSMAFALLMVGIIGVACYLIQTALE